MVYQRIFRKTELVHAYRLIGNYLQKKKFIMLNGMHKTCLKYFCAVSSKENSCFFLLFDSSYLLKKKKIKKKWVISEQLIIRYDHSDYTVKEWPIICPKVTHYTLWANSADD